MLIYFLRFFLNFSSETKNQKFLDFIFVELNHNFNFQINYLIFKKSIHKFFLNLFEFRLDLTVFSLYHECKHRFFAVILKI